MKTLGIQEFHWYHSPIEILAETSDDELDVYVIEAHADAVRQGITIEGDIKQFYIELREELRLIAGWESEGR